MIDHDFQIPIVSKPASNEYRANYDKINWNEDSDIEETIYDVNASKKNKKCQSKP